MDEATLLLRHYFNGGGSAMPAIRKLIDAGELDQAAVVARLAVRRADGAERKELFAVLGEITSADGRKCWRRSPPHRVKMPGST